MRRARNVDVQGVADRLAHVQGFKQGQLFGVLFQQAGETDHGGFALGRRQARPDTGIEGGASVFHGALGIGGVTAGNLAQQTAIDRADALERLAGNGVGVFAIDIGAAFDFQVAGTLFPVGTGQGGHASVLLLLNTTPAFFAGAVRNSARPACFSAQGIHHPKPAAHEVSIYLT
ncbi:hypothetical protein D3C76_1359960 [compost metagenome]